jgi:uncharacterized OB-fold protein
MAVAAVRPLVDQGEPIDEICLVTRSPSLLEGDTAAIVAHALGDESIHVNVVLGGAPDVVHLLTTAALGSVIVGVEVGDNAGAGAVLVAAGGASATSAGAHHASLPIRVHRAGESSALVYDDPRLLREVGWRNAVAPLVTDESMAIVGIANSVARTFGNGANLAEGVHAGGPAAVAFALAEIARFGSGRLIAVEQASAEAVDVVGVPEVIVNRREGIEQIHASVDSGAAIPISLAAYARAFPAKVGLRAGRCDVCGTLSCPPRYRCLECGDEGHSSLIPLPHQATVYTVVTVRVPVPGLATPYSLAIVELGDTGVRMLVQVTDAVPGSTGIGDDGTLVFRKVSDRQGIPDYGWAFQPEQRTAMEVAHG